MAIEKNADYLAEAITRLLAQFKGKPRVQSLLKAWLNGQDTNGDVMGFQMIENAMWDVFTERVLQGGLATGDLLDKIGKIVGQDRQGFADDTYTAMISARIRANRSTGRRRDLIAITQLLSPGFVVYARDYPPASVRITVRTNDVPADIMAKQFLIGAVEAGVKLMFVWTSKPFGQRFYTTSVYGATVGFGDLLTGPDNGFGSVYVSTGGFLAGVFSGEGT